MSDAAPLAPPSLPIPAEVLPPFKALWMGVRNNLSTWPRVAYEEPVWRRRFFGADVLVVSDPAGVRHILNEAAENYVRPVVALRALRPFGGAGLFLSEGADWRRQRKMLSPIFTPGRVNLLTPHFQAAAEHLLRRLDSVRETNLSRDFQDVALEAVLRALFSLPEMDQREKIGALVRFYFSGPGKPNVLDVFARGEEDFSWFSRGRRKFRSQWQTAIDDLIAARKAAPKQGDGRDLLDLLLAVRDAASGEGLATPEIRDQCSTMLVAGFETTARLMFWLSYLLALDPTEQEAVRAEIRNFPPEKLQCLDDLAHWPRLRQNILEALRLYPPAPHVLRQALGEDVVCGETVNAETQIWISPWIIHRHRKYWERPELFLPERFAGKANPGSAPWSGGAPYMPFGAGPRICIGAAFALAEAQIVLAAFLSRYRLSLADSRPVLPVGAVTIVPNREPVFKLERV